MIDGPVSAGLKIALFASVSKRGHCPTTPVGGRCATDGMKTDDGFGV
jgi:hypothetical protein